MVEPKLSHWLTAFEEHFAREPRLILTNIDKIRQAKRFIHESEGNAYLTIEYNSSLIDSKDAVA